MKMFLVVQMLEGFTRPFAETFDNLEDAKTSFHAFLRENRGVLTEASCSREGAAWLSKDKKSFVNLSIHDSLDEELDPEIADVENNHGQRKHEFLYDAIVDGKEVCGTIQADTIEQAIGYLEAECDKVIKVILNV